MNAKKCDRCGKYFHINLATYENFAIIGMSLKIEGGCLYSFDLCDDCINKLTQWLDGKSEFVDKQKDEKW